MLVKTPVIHSRYNLPPNPGFKNDEPSMTQQQFKDEADVNYIMARYQKTGVLVDPLTQATRKPMFDDFSELGDFRDHQQAVIDAQELFMQSRLGSVPVLRMTPQSSCSGSLTLQIRKRL